MKKILAVLFTFIVFASIVSPALAQETYVQNRCLVSPGGGQGAVVTMQCIPVLVSRIIYYLLVFSGVVALFFIIFGGIKLLTSGGDQAKVEGARKTITWAIIGLIVVLLSFMIVNILADVTGANCIIEFGFTNCAP